MNRCALASIVALLVSAWSSAGHAFVREESRWNAASLPISYAINLSTAPASIGATGARTAVEGGFTSWAGPTCTAWRTTDTGDTTRRASQSDRLNTILWISGSWPATLGDPSSVIGVTTPVWTSGGYFIDADIQFNNVGFTWSLDGARNTVDTQSIATHEEGHFLGLDHPPVPSAIMYASYGGGLKRVLTSDDSSGVCAIYPSGTTTPPPDAGTVVDAGTPAGTGATGSPCADSSDCASSRCVSDGTNSFCTANCADDCGCPGGFQCRATSLGMICVPGARTCATTVRDSGTTTPPLGTIGDRCTVGTQCSDRFCAFPAGTTAGFCTRACADDSTCPCGYQCFPTDPGGPHVCGPGTDLCASDAGVTAVGDASVGPDAAAHDAGGDAGPVTNNPGCGCAVPGAPASSSPIGAMVAVAALAMFTSRRRRRAA